MLRKFARQGPISRLRFLAAILGSSLASLRLSGGRSRGAVAESAVVTGSHLTPTLPGRHLVWGGGEMADEIRERIRVGVRLRPCGSDDATKAVTLDGVRKRLAIPSRNAKGTIEYGFDQIFDETAAQRDVYEFVSPAVCDVATRGLNATVFAYGQTGTGKTHTILGGSLEKLAAAVGMSEGGPEGSAPSSVRSSQSGGSKDSLPAGCGLIPRAATELFATLAQSQSGASSDNSVKRYSVHCSYLQARWCRAYRVSFKVTHPHRPVSRNSPFVPFSLCSDLRGQSV